MKKTFQIIALAVVLVFPAKAIAQDFSTLEGLKSYLRTAEAKKVMPKPQKMVERIPANVAEQKFALDFTEFGSFSRFVEDLAVPESQVEGLLHGLFGFSADYTFAKMPSTTDELGIKHTNYYVYYKGYLVDGQMVMVHSKNGILRSINGIVKRVGNPTFTAKVTPELSLMKAKTAIKVVDLVDKYPSEKVWTEVSKNGKTYYRLAEKVKVFSLTPMKKYNVYIDVENGETLRQVSLLPHADITVTANTFFDGLRSITVDSLGSTSYLLSDNARRITTYNGSVWSNTRYLPSSDAIVTSNRKNFGVDSLRPAVQVHWGMEKTYDYYLSRHQRSSYDGAGGDIYNIYNPVAFDNEGMAFNAAAMGNGVMVYGRGGDSYDYGVNYHPLVALDIAAHEFTHLVTDHSSSRGLEYEGESGALNESFSDIFGVSVDFYTDSAQANWLIGEDIYVNGGFMRSMSEPSSPQLSYNERQPDTYKGSHWVNTSNTSKGNDYGGVHTNSGVQNLWYYLLCMGGSGVNDNGVAYNVTAIGMRDAERIAYKNLMQYLPYDAKYVDAYTGSLNATRDLFGQNSQQYRSVIEAWRAVGIDSTMPMPCRGEQIVTTNSGMISDGSGNEKYATDKMCKWHIKTTQGRAVKLYFTAFDLEESDPGSFYDYVAVYDGTSERSTLLGQYAGKKLPTDTLRSTGTDMFVVFKSDRSMVGEGFEAKYDTYGVNSIQPIEISQSDIAVYPNPATDAVTLRFSEPHTSLSVQIMDMVGRVVKSETLNVQAENPVSFDISELPEGVYTLRFTDENGYSRATKLLVK